MELCDACKRGQHWDCGMQTWCECECDPDAFDHPDNATAMSDEQPDEDDYDPPFDCHMDKRGFCGMAGSEDCDFECPYRNVKRN